MIKPLYDKVVVKRNEKEVVSEGGIFIPSDITKEAPSIGVILATGQGKANNKNNSLKPMSVNVGEKVLFGKYAGQEVQLENKEKVLLMREEDILGIFSDDNIPNRQFITTDNGEKLYPILDAVIFKFCANLTKSTFQPISSGGIIISDKEDYDENVKDQWVEILAVGPEVCDEIRNAKYALVENQQWTHKIRCNGPYGEYLWKTDESKIIFVSDEYYNPY